MTDKKGRKFSFPRDRKPKAKDAVSGKDAAAGEKPEPVEETAPAREEPQPPEFIVKSRPGSVKLIVPAKDRKMVAAGLEMVVEQVSRGASAIRTLGLPPVGRLEGIKNVAQAQIKYIEEAELDKNGFLPVVLNASEAPVIRIALWLYERWAEAQNEKSEKKGLGTAVRHAVAICQKMTDQINDQLSLL